jgi:hypothetical protein
LDGGSQTWGPRRYLHFEHGRKRQWQTIVKKIRAAASREANKLRVVRVVNRKPAADKASRADSKVASRIVKVDNRAVRRVISRATANLFEGEVSSLGLTFILIGRSQARAPQNKWRRTTIYMAMLPIRRKLPCS